MFLSGAAMDHPVSFICKVQQYSCKSAEKVSVVCISIEMRKKEQFISLKGKNAEKSCMLQRC
jgi:hypothetical protein